MQKIKDVLRMHLLGGAGSCRQMARAVGCGKLAVADCLRRARVENLNDWASVAAVDEVELSRRLYPPAGVTAERPPSARPLPDWTKVREELARADHQMTLALLWEEYKGQHPNAPRSCTPTTRPLSCSRRAPARPRLSGCGLTCAMIGLPRVMIRQRCCFVTRPIVKASGRGST